MNVKTTFAGVCAFFLLLSILPLAAPQQAELPTWNVGDTWAMGVRDVDLGPIFKTLMETTPGITANVSGKASYFVIYKVEGEDAQYYRVSVSQGMEMSGTVSGTQYGTTYSSSMRTSMVIKGDGSLYYTKDKLAFAKGDMTLNLTMNSSMDAGAAGSMDMSGDMTVNMSFTCSPPLDIFNFPISVGENWTVESVVTTTGRITGKITVKVKAMGREQSLDNAIDQPISETTNMSLSMSCPGTVDIPLASTCYKLVISGTGATPSGMVAPGVVLYYSPDRRFVAASDVTFGGVLSLGALRPTTGGQIDLSKLGGDQPLFSMRPVSEQEAQSAIAAMGAKGINLVLVVFVVVIIVAVIAAAVVVIKRRGTEANFMAHSGESRQDF